MKKDFALLEKLGISNPQEIKYTWELESDSLSFDQQMKNLDAHIRKYTFRDDGAQAGLPPVSPESSRGRHFKSHQSAAIS
jgi:hypothetical protein